MPKQLTQFFTLKTQFGETLSELGGVPCSTRNHAVKIYPGKEYEQAIIRIIKLGGKYRQKPPQADASHTDRPGDKVKRIDGVECSPGVGYGATNAWQEVRCASHKPALSPPCITRGLEHEGVHPSGRQQPRQRYCRGSSAVGFGYDHQRRSCPRVVA